MRFNLGNFIQRKFLSSMTNKEIRVRYAPSPTGYLHLGGMRTALFNYLFAKSKRGKFILRIEDTDKTREVPGSVDALIKSLEFCGIKYDEGPTIGGDYGPYKQSERTDLYRKYANKLVDCGHAYLCFCTTERLKILRETQQLHGQPTMYDRCCIGLTPDDIQRNLSLGKPYTIRMKITNGTTVLKDILHGYIQFSHDVLDDQVLLKSDGYPTYHLANVVDDHLMKITHVIRGEEWLSSTPKHLLLYKALGFQPPLYAHLGLLLNVDRSKLSKRQGDVAVEDFKAKGFLPSALVNFVALLGWNPSRGDTQEVFTMSELINKFSLEDVNKSGSIVDLNRLKWLNSRHIRLLFNNPEEKERVTELCINTLEEQLYTLTGNQSTLDEFDREYIYSALNLLKDRVTFLHNFAPLCSYFFYQPDYTTEIAKSFYKSCWNSRTFYGISHVLVALNSLPVEQFKAKEVKKALKEVAQEHNFKLQELLMPLRYCITGIDVGAGMAETMELIGKAICLHRIQKILNNNEE